jgi:phospholipid/cholesterol/gamma-HCH transport system substrate-binding protein
MPKLSTEAKVGLLVLGGSVILLWMTFVVGKFEFGAKKGYTITAVFDSVAGLDAKAAVRMAGVKIGSVETIELEDSRAKVVMRILPDVKIKQGSRAGIKTMGLMGEKFVEITPPESGAGGGGAAGADPPGDPPGQSAYLREGDQIQITSSPSDVDKLISQLSGIADDVKQVTASLRQVFGTERGTRSMEDILADLRQTTANIRDFSHTLRSDGGELVMRLNELTASLNSVVAENRDNLKVTMENIREASKNAELALASIEDAAKKVDRGEGTLGKLVTDDSMYNNIDSAAQGLSDYTGRVGRLQTILSFRSEYMFPDAKTYFSLDLKPKPDKYYTLEVISDPRYKFSQSILVSNPGGVLTTDTYQDKFLFSLLFVKRWGNLGLRLGLMESTGGIGAEYYMLDDKIKFSLDAWNFSSKEPGNENTHLKATVSYSINKLLFVDAGYDNFLNAGRKAGFVGAGLRFDDDDLKYLIGSVPIPK